jgi:hypothetical protein
MLLNCIVIGEVVVPGAFKLYADCAVVVNLKVKFDKQGIQMKVNDEVKSKADSERIKK